MKRKKINVFICTHIGNSKTANEDNFIVNDLFNEHSFDFSKHELKASLPCIAGVFDGISGLSNGKYASKIAAKMARILYGKIKVSSNPEDDLKSFYNGTNKILCKFQKENNINLGTTAALAVIRENDVLFSNLGDSRIYLLSDGTLNQVSKDHNEAGFLLDAGLITPQEALHHPMKNILCQYLGDTDINFVPEPYIASCEISSDKQQIILICSDGISDVLTCEQIKECILDKSNNSAERLVKLSLENGSKDNATAVVIYMS